MDATKRIFIPGDEWLYIKIYTGFKTADIILAEVFPGILKKLKAEQITDRWFFIRYMDPEHHLRVRFYLNDPNNLSIISIINEFLKPYVSNGLVWKVQVDTYQRELERYGEETIEHAETIFNHDSEAIINILSLLQDDATDNYRWQVALKMIDNFLNDFGFNIDRKHTIATYLSENYRTEFGFTTSEYKVQLDKKYRNHRKTVEEVLSNSEVGIEWMAQISSIIEKKSQKVQPIVKSLLDMESQQTLKVSLNDLLGSYIHMMINRLFRSKQRITEMVIYNMLEKHYNSSKARSKK
jgi:thiopeptide-type bacteriocin biosynthesis protein